MILQKIVNFDITYVVIRIIAKYLFDQTRFHENGAKECIVQISTRAFT